MGDYFKPWRRKIGVVTLVMACVFAAGWVRSLTFVEAVDWQIYQSGVILGSIDSHFGLFVVEDGKSNRFSYPEWGTVEFRTVEELVSEGGTPVWHWQRFGFHVAAIFDRYSVYGLILAPYWSIVIPLTLLSAYLLLSKPRVVKPKAIAEPISETVA